jgi:hypothetical protein
MLSVRCSLFFESGNGRLVAAVGELGDGGGVLLAARILFICAGDARRGIVCVLFLLACILAKTMPVDIRARADWLLLPKTDQG